MSLIWGIFLSSIMTCSRIEDGVRSHPRASHAMRFRGRPAGVRPNLAPSLAVMTARDVSQSHMPADRHWWATL